MKQAEYEIFVSNLRKYHNLDLFSYKQNQVQRRVNSDLVKKDYKSYRELFEEMRYNPNLVEEFIENMTINVSNFFRNKAKWDILQKEILPEIIRKNPGKLKIWSAACSSGEEPYTLSIILSRLLQSHQYEIIATDLDLQILDKAKKGAYHERSMIEVPSQVKRSCFDYIDGIYHIKDVYKRNVRFQKHDLLLQPYGVNYHLIICRNVMIYFTEQAKDSLYKKFNKVSKKNSPFLKEVPSQPLQEVFARLKKAFDNFFRKDAKYPKQKKYKDYNSLTFPQFGFNKKGNRMAMSFSDNGKLYNTKLGEVDILLHRPLEGTIKQLIIKRQGKKWYAIFSVAKQAVPSVIDVSNAVGIDVGINKYAVLSNGLEYENPKFLRKKEKQLKRAQQILSRKQKGSSNYINQVQRVRQLHEKIANQRRDFLHKLSYNLSKDYSVIIVEDLNIRNMVKNRKLSKSISDAGWGMFRNMVFYKCEREGGLLHKVAPQYTSQDCSCCGSRVKKSLSMRTHVCAKCGTVLDRDHNAALNILQKGLVEL